MQLLIISLEFITKGQCYLNIKSEGGDKDKYLM